MIRSNCLAALQHVTWANKGLHIRLVLYDQSAKRSLSINDLGNSCNMTIMNIINHFVPLWNGIQFDLDPQWCDWSHLWKFFAMSVSLRPASQSRPSPQIPQAYPTHPTHPTPNMRDKSRYAVNCFIMFHNVSYMFIWQHVHSTSGRIWMNLVGGLERFRINDSYHARISDGLVDGIQWNTWLWVKTLAPVPANSWLMDVYSPKYGDLWWFHTFRHITWMRFHVVHHGPPWSTRLVKSHLDLYIVIACRLCHRDTVGGISRFRVHDPLRTWAGWQAWNGMSMEIIWWNTV